MQIDVVNDGRRRGNTLRSWRERRSNHSELHSAETVLSAYTGMRAEPVQATLERNTWSQR